MKWLLLIALTMGCAHIPSAKVEHYIGEVILTIPGGKKPFGRLPTVVRITKDPDAGLIMEEAVLPGRTAKDHAREIVMNYQHTDEFGVFNVHDNLKSFKGTVRFVGTPWHWEEWHMNFVMKDKVSVKGLALKEDGIIKTRKIIYNAKGKPLFVQREVLTPTTASEYKKLRQQIVQRKLKYKK
jgi:hypothetical protein